MPFLYKNNGSKKQLLCKICNATFLPDEGRFSAAKLQCPHCGRALTPKKERKHFIVHKCVNPECPYYLNNLKKVDKTDLAEKYGKNKYKLHYIYREFTMDFFSMDLNSLPKNASSLKFSKHSTHILSLCLTMHVNLGLSLRKTAHTLKELYNVNISHQQVANYDLALWMTYYNFLRPHKHAGYKVLNEVEMLQNADNMPAMWQILIYLGQQTILDMQKNKI